MNANLKHLKKRLMALVLLLLGGALLGLPAGTGAQPVQASFLARATRTRTRTPTPTATPVNTPTPQPPACWTVVPGPNVPGYAAELRAVAGSADNDVWAVGWFDDNSSRHTLTLHWNGSSWQRVPSPDVVNVGSNSINALYSVAVVASNDVWAVGYAASLSTPYQTITLHWNGSAWQVVPSPNVNIPGFYNTLNGVVAISSNDVWAVGGGPSNVSGPYGRSLLMHWNGSAWQFFPEPAEVALWSTVSRTGVAARASNDVWAVGTFAAWHWDGSTWSVPSGFSGQNLLGVGSNGGALWSAGTNPGYQTSEGGYVPASPNAQFYDGTTWRTTIPVDPGNGAGFNSTKVISAANVWAVGYAGKYVLTEKWNGSQWINVPAANGNPNPSANVSFANVLLGVNGTSTGLWAVGYYYDAAIVQRVLIERYTCQ